jgi:predicted nuclease of predicted toxin-antitoxin system
LRILADANIPRAAVTALTGAGHDVVWARTAFPTSPDEQVIATAVAESRVVITFDKDFGEQVFRKGADASAGVILLRLPFLPADRLASFLVALMERPVDWSGKFATVEMHRIRINIPPRL